MKHPLATDLVEFVDEQPADKRMTLAHIAACEPCRRAVVNIIQTNDAYPDLFANPADAALRGSALSVAPEACDCSLKDGPDAGADHIYHQHGCATRRAVRS